MSHGSNGLNQRITTHFDTDGDKDVDGSRVPWLLL